MISIGSLSSEGLTGLGVVYVRTNIKILRYNYIGKSYTYNNTTFLKRK